MSNQLIERVEDNNVSHRYLTWGHTTQLQDTKQKIVDTHNYETSYQNGNWVSVKKEPIKVILKELHYSLDEDKMAFELDCIVVLGFRKDKRIKAREEYLYRRSGMTDQFNEVLSQIPDSYHDSAKETFHLKMKELIDQLDQIAKNGVIIK